MPLRSKLACPGVGGGGLEAGEGVHKFETGIKKENFEIILLWN